MTAWPLAVIGAGPAGAAAAVEAARQGVRPLVLDATGHAGGTIRMAHEVRNVPFLPGPVTGKEVGEHVAAYLSRWEVPVQRTRVRAISETPGGWSLATNRGKVAEARRVVIAVGTEPRFPAIEGLKPGPRFVGSAEDAVALGDVHRAVVLGGSDVAMDQARWLRARGVEVDVLIRSEPRAPGWLVHAARQEGAVLQWPARAVGAVPSGEALRVIVRQGEETVEFRVDVAVAAIGRKPVAIDGGDAAALSHPACVRIVGDGTGRRARHVIAALGEGCVAAAEILSAAAGGLHGET